LGHLRRSRRDGTNAPFVLMGFCMVGVLWLHVCLAAAPFQNWHELPVNAPVRELQKMAVISLAEVDADFAYQGEYYGWLGDSYGCRPSGLQVVAMGDGKFDAVRFEGGLPGNGAYVRRPKKLQGLRLGSLLVLEASDGESIEVEPNEARIFRGQIRLGKLSKVYRHSPTLGRAPPPQAIVLFGDQQSQPQLDKAPTAQDGTLLVGSTTTVPVHDFQLHLEFRTPYMPYARGQGRGNSGVYIQRRYEVQILDSFGLEGAPNECGGLYRQKAPDLNMCLPPLAWQTYDIYFTAARWDGENRKLRPAIITVFHNGVAIHDRYAIVDKTGAGRPEGPEPLPIHFQDHGNPVTFRNLWIVMSDRLHYTTTQCACRPRKLALLARLLFCRR
jgi:hypothetical protein